MNNSLQMYNQLNELYRSVKEFDAALVNMGISIELGDDTIAGKCFNTNFELIPELILNLIEAQEKSISTENFIDNPLFNTDIIYSKNYADFYIIIDDFYDLIYSNNTVETMQLFWDGFINNDKDAQTKLNNILQKQLFCVNM